MVGTPFLPVDTAVRTGSLNKIINIYGSDDQFLNSNDLLPDIPKKFTHLQHAMETINIELKGINHTEYFYANETTPTQEQVRASDFIARLTQAALNPIDLEQLLLILGVPFEDITDSGGDRVRTYKVDLSSIP